MKQAERPLLHEVVSVAAGEVPERVALVTPRDPVPTTTFAELDVQVRGVAAWTAANSALGDRIAVVADNSLAYAQMYYGVPRAGRTLALINQRLSPAEQLALIAAAEPSVVVGDPRFLDELPSLQEYLSSVNKVVMLGSDEWQQGIAERHDEFHAAQPDDAAWLLFTSGSTGAPKRVVHTHRSLLAAVHGAIEGRNVQPGGTYLLPFPMCHIAGYNTVVQHQSQCSVVLSPAFRPDAFVKWVNEYGVTSCSLAPTMLHALLAHVEATGEDMPALQAVGYGAAAIPADLLRRAMDRLDVEFHQGYGMTETAGNVTFLGPAEHRAGVSRDPAILRTVGRPHSAVEVRVVDDVGDDVPSGEAGEIVVRGQQVMLGYWRDEVATAEAFVDGWLRTGDIGRLGADGRLAVVDRRKDVIITGGENVASREVEDVLSSHPEVDIAAVVGVPDDYWGEAICAVVVATDASRPPAPARLIAYVRETLSPFKRPRHVLFVEELPYTTNGKVAKEQVRRMARHAASLAWTLKQGDIIRRR